MLAGLIAEAATRFDPQLAAIIVHGIGAMAPGAVSVAIHVALAHRALACAACRHLIERLKQDLLVYKARALCRRRPGVAEEIKSTWPVWQWPMVVAAGRYAPAMSRPAPLLQTTKQA